MGSYVSVPGAFKDADEGVKHFLKMEFTTHLSDKSSDPLKLETGFSTDHVLLDFKGMVPSDLDSDKIVKDCDFLKEIALKHPEKLRQLAEAYTESPTGFKKAYAIAKEIGLTEESAVKAGGGVFWLVAIAALALMSGSCEHCHVGHPPHPPS